MGHVYLATLTLALLSCWLQSRFRPAWVLVLGVQLSAAMGVELTALLLTGTSNHWLYNFYMPIEFSALTAIAYLLWPDELPFRKWIPYSLLPFALAYGIHLSRGAEHLATEALIVGGFVLLVVYVTLLVHDAATNETPFWRVPSSWICLSTIIYYGCAAPFMGVLNYVNDLDEGMSSALYAINDGASIVRYFLVVVCVFLLPKAIPTAS